MSEEIGYAEFHWDLIDGKWICRETGETRTDEEMKQRIKDTSWHSLSPIPPRS